MTISCDPRASAGLRALLLLAAAAGSTQAAAALPAGLSGAWFNPSQSGHGISLQIISPDAGLLFWYAYDREGRPMPLYVEGRIVGRRIEGTAYRPSGMRFGIFDPVTTSMPIWGEVTLDFEDCNRATLSWSATSPEFGSASLPMTRLAPLHGVGCEFSGPDRAPAGAYDLRMEHRSFVDSGDPVRPEFPGTGYAAIDSAGTLWAVEYRGADRDYVQGPVNVDQNRQVAIAPSIATAREPSAFLALNYWARSQPSPSGAHRSAQWRVADEGRRFELFVEFPPFTGNIGGALRTLRSTQQWTLDASADRIVAPLAMAQLSRRFTQLLSAQFVADSRAFVDIDEGGNVCVRIEQLTGPPCHLDGRVWISDAETGFLDFELVEHRFAGTPAYRGRGWLHQTESGTRLILVGQNGSAGLGIIAR